MKRADAWKLFFETGLPQAYTYAKARERSSGRRGQGGAPGRRG